MKLSKRNHRGGGFTWVIRWREGNRQRQVSLKGIESQEAAEMALAELRNRRERGAVGWPTEPRYSVKAALADLIDAREGTVKQRQFKRFKAMAQLIEKVLGPQTPIAKLTPADAARLRRHLQGEKEFSAYTVNKYVQFLVAAIDGAVRADKIGRNPLAGIPRVSDEQREVWRFLSEEEIARLYGVLDEGYAVTNKSRSGNEYQTRYRPPEGLRDLVTFLLNTGARLGEALAVQWRDVDFKNEQVRLYSTKRASKGRKAAARYIPMNRALKDLLKRLHKGAAHAGDDPVLALDPRGLSRKFSIVAQRAGLGHVRIHDLRHTFCSHLAMAGVPLSTIKALAGHSTIVMTDRYAHLSPNARAQGVDSLNFGASNQGAKVVSVADQA